MAESIDELTIHYEEDGIRDLVRSRGLGDVYKRQVSIRRYQKREGTFLQRSKFEVSSPNQARAICNKIQDWFPEEK